MRSPLISIFYTEIGKDNLSKMQKNYQNNAKNEQKLVCF